MRWHLAHNTREMPWKGEKDPYRIWLSEVILQQTRVAQGMSYYNAFVSRFPNIGALAAAPDQEVFKLWEGLGYYNRCKNLLFTARQIVAERNGSFPDTYETLLALKGVGPYTAAAIASFAYNLPFAVVDGNVFRVLARYFGIETPIDSAAGKDQFSKLAAEVLDRREPGLHNQAIMDFGATICKPVAPACSLCPVRTSCIAFAEGRVNLLPVKEKTLHRRTRWFYYFLFELNGSVLVHKRTARDIWENLFEFFLLESEEQIKWTDLQVAGWLREQAGVEAEVLHITKVQSQQLTHQQIRGQFISIKLSSMPELLSHYEWQPLENLRSLPFPKFITSYLGSVVFSPGLF